MATEKQPPLTVPDASAADDRLDSWKEIAAYLRRDITTVRRWEKREALPVHRHLHERRDSVYAFRSEIDAWWGRRGELSSGDAAPPGEPATESRRLLSREAVAWSLVATLLIATLALIWSARNPDATTPMAPRLRFAIVPPEGTTIDAMSLSPDGQRLAFAAAPLSGPSLTPRLWVQRLDELRARVIADTDGAHLPFWSPRGDSLGFFADGRLWIVTLAGGAPRAIANVQHARGGTWNQDDEIVFAPGREAPLYRVPASGGTPQPVTTLDEPAERGHVWPSFLPDGRRFLYLADSNQREGHNLFIGSLDGSPPTLVLAGGLSNATYTESGMLVYGHERRLVARPFDLARLTQSGEEIVLADSVHEPDLDHLHDFTAVRNVLVYRSRQSAAVRLVWRDREGRRAPFIDEPAEYFCPTLSPDETRITAGLFYPQPSRRFGYGSAEIRSDIVMFDRATGARSMFVQDSGAEWGTVWSPDGRQVVFSSNRRDRILELFSRPAVGDDANAERVLAVEAGNPVAQSWSPDGRYVLYAAFDPTTHMDLWLLPATGARQPVVLLQSEFNEMQGQISPDGRWVAYSSDESGRFEVYVQSFPVPGSKRQLSTDGGGDPRWRHDGRELFYIAADRHLMSVAVSTRGGFDASAPVALFDTGMPPQWYEARNLYDVSRDGRFLFMEPVDDDRSMPLTVLANWLGR